MAITATLARQTKYSVAFVLTHDGQAGDALTIANATLLAAANQGGPIAELLASAAANNQVARRILGGYDTLNPIDAAEHALWVEVRITPHSGAAQDWSAVAVANAGAIDLDIAQVGAAEALLELIVRHSYDR